MRSAVRYNIFTWTSFSSFLISLAGLVRVSRASLTTLRRMRSDIFIFWAAFCSLLVRATAPFFNVCTILAIRVTVAALNPNFFPFLYRIHFFLLTVQLYNFFSHFLISIFFIAYTYHYIALEIFQKIINTYPTKQKKTLESMK